MRCDEPLKSNDCDNDKIIIKIPTVKSNTANYSKCPYRLRIIKQKEEKQKLSNTGYRGHSNNFAYIYNFPALRSSTLLKKCRVSQEPKTSINNFYKILLLKNFCQIITLFFMNIYNPFSSFIFFDQMRCETESIIAIA